MAGTAVNTKVLSVAGSDLRAAVASVNALVVDVEALRTGLAALAAAFNAHTHKTPTSNPGFTSIPNTDASGAGSSGGASAVVTVTTYDAAGDLTAFLVKDQNSTTVANDAR